MKIIQNLETDPYFNLAAEEYLLDNCPGEIFSLWRNDRSVIIGRSQNAYAELDLGFVTERRIPVVRRLTGGGAVFHDLGNVNYTFITDEARPLDFAHFSRPIVDALAGLGVRAVLSGRNDLTADGMKISGAAQCVRRGRILHHGTLLFDADLSELAGALRPDPAKLSSKGIASVRSRVTNIRRLLGEDCAMDAVGFYGYLMSYAVGNWGGKTAYGEAEKAAIRRLAETKYRTWAWNFGESRAYDRERRQRFPFGSVEVGLTVERGRIASVRIRGDFFGVREIGELEAALIGLRYEREALAGALREVGSYIHGAAAEDILGLFL